MKKVFLKNIIAITIATTTVVNLSTVTAYAVWNKDLQNRWTWTENGVKSKGWKKIEGKWYYFDVNGIMKTGWLKVEGKWYHLDNSGAMTVGWLKDNDGKWYYLSQSGAMVTGWLKDSDGKWYHLSGSGAMTIGWLRDYDGKWYHLSSSGAMTIGWLSNNGSKYYLNSSGVMLTGVVTISGKKYIFSDSGALINDESVGETNDTSSNEKRSGYVSTKSGALNVRSEAISSSNIIGTLEKGTNVIITGQAINGFYKVSANGLEGWASSSWIIIGENSNSDDESNDTSLEEKKIAYINTESGSLNIRAGASKSSSVIGTLAKGTQITVIGQSVNGFYRISAKDLQGWASSDWITFEKPDSKPADSDDNTNIILGPIRTTPPSTSDRHYYSDDNIFYRVKLSPPYYKADGNPILGNCTWYAWGRIWELTGKTPSDAGFTGNGYEWWGANNKTGKYKTGYKPKVGALAVWKSSLPGSGGLGHVAIVEKIENNKIYISESSWHGSLFKYREIYDTNHLYGYIYIDEPNY